VPDTTRSSSSPWSAWRAGFRLKVASERGAYGLVQLKPSTFAWISAREPDLGGEDLDVADDPVVDVRLAIRYFHWLERSFRTRDEALMAYNAGPKRIKQYRGRVKDIRTSTRSTRGASNASTPDSSA